MAVYTVLEQGDIDALAVTLGLGTPLQWRGVSTGIENSTYFLTLQAQEGGPREYVLTIAEAASAADVRFIATWMAQLADSGLPVPAPQRHPVTGEPMLTLHGKPAMVVPKIQGEHLLTPEPMHCAELGHALGRMHAVAQRSGQHYPSPRGLDWLSQTARRLLPRLDPADHTLLAEELARLDQLRAAGLPAGIIHGDLFRDNALFRGQALVAIIDFFMAGSGPLAFDLAIAVNDWCSHANGALDPQRAAALLSAYARERPLTPEEQKCWPDLLCLAATRFWVSRLQTQLEPRALGAGALPGSKNPDELRNLLLQRRQRQ